MENTTDIFQFIEKKLNEVVPAYIKNILKYCGYDNCHALATIDDDDLEYFAGEVRNGGVNNFYHGKMNAESIMEGCTKSIENFVFSRGHIQLLKAIVRMVKETLEVHGADGFLLKLPKVLPKEQEKENIISKSASVYRKRFKFSAVTSTSPQGVDDSLKEVTISRAEKARTTLISKAIFSLITHTPILFANTFERMITNEILIQIEIKIEEGVAHIRCPYCLKSYNAFLSNTKLSNTTWWNTSNFDRHVETLHKDFSHFDTERDCELDSENIHRSTDFRLSTSQRPAQDRFCSKCKKEESDTKSLGMMLQNFVDSHERNTDRKKAGYRFDELTKMFAAYIFMLCGLLAYETINANLPLSMPSTSTVHRYITRKGPRVIEAEMRTDELLKYLKDRKLPLQVSLSEDATRITAKISYDPATNQLIGFAPPLNESGMPIKFSFPARNTSEIQSHYINPSNFVSSTAYVQIAQPLDENTPPFCLMIYLIDNTFTANNVLKRWRFQASKLKEKGISIYNIATDGDSRPLSAMKILSKIGQSDKSYFDCEWFSCGGYAETTFTKDMVHILTKLRNRLLTFSRIFPIGRKIVSLSHIKYLIENVSKDKHLLTSYDIEPKDRQNFASAEKLCSENTMKCLIDYVPGSEATVIYLKAMWCILSAFSDISNLQSTERIYRMWRAVFLFRGWRSWLLNSEKINKYQKKSKNFYTLKDNFISSNCYTCIELNAHSLVKKILSEDLPADNTCSEKEEVFFPNLFSSQPCESTFRQVRSFTSTFSTVVNFNMLDIIHRIDKIQLQSDIINRSNGRIKFPRFDKKVDMAKSSDNTVLQKLNRATIISEIEKARNDVICDLEKLGIDTSKLNFHCQVKPVLEQDISEIDSDLVSDSDEIDLLFEHTEELEDDFHSEEDAVMHSDYLSGITGDLMLKDYGERLTEIESERITCIDEKSPFVAVVDGQGNEKIVRKSSLCWLLAKDKHKLSSDRLVRVTEKDYSTKTLGNNAVPSSLLTADKYFVHDHVTIGEWGIFSKTESNELLPKILVGMVLGFKYLDGKTFKAQEFSKVSAPVLSNFRDVGVLCAFYTFTDNGKLTARLEDKHNYINIQSYVGTIKPPIYVSKDLAISKELAVEIKHCNNCK